MRNRRSISLTLGLTALLGCAGPQKSHTAPTVPPAQPEKSATDTVAVEAEAPSAMDDGGEPDAAGTASPEPEARAIAEERSFAEEDATAGTEPAADEAIEREAPARPAELAAPGKGGGGVAARRKSSPRGRPEREARPGAGGSGISGSGDGAPARTYKRTRSAPAMRAGRHDDNKQYNRFLTFLQENRRMVIYPVDISERLVVRTLDKDGASLANCKVEVESVAGMTFSRSVTYADGSTHFFPAEQSTPRNQDYVVRARCGQYEREGQLSREGRRVTEVRFKHAREVPRPLPVDIAIVIDTTGSMGSQIERLKQTLQAIHFQLTQMPAQPDIRFALVAYRDRGDSYVTRVRRFERDVDAFQHAVNELDADGGGDTPEDLQEALDKAMHVLDWREDALRLGFVIADAIPHTDYNQKFNYRDAMRESLRRGIKWTTVGAGGLGRDGEVIFRQLAQFTMGEYVFVTQGAAGDHEGGTGEASHHVGSNYKTENLDQAIVRIVKREMSYMTDEPLDFDETIVATANSDHVTREQVLAPAVKELLRQLVDYSSLRLERATPVVIGPVITPSNKDRAVAEYLSEQMLLVTSRHPTFRVLERDMEKLGQEIKLQVSELFDVEKTVPIGKMVGADVMIIAKLTTRADGATLFARLVRIETGELLSVAKVEMNDKALRSAS